MLLGGRASPSQSSSGWEKTDEAKARALGEDPNASVTGPCLIVCLTAWDVGCCKVLGSSFFFFFASCAPARRYPNFCSLKRHEKYLPHCQPFGGADHLVLEECGRGARMNAPGLLVSSRFNTLSFLQIFILLAEHVTLSCFC